MKFITYLTLHILLFANTSTLIYGQNKTESFEGRWDLTIHENETNYAAWLEIKPWGYTKVGSFLNVGGYPRPLSEIKVKGNQFNFELPWASKNDTLKVEGKIKNDNLLGEIHYSDGKTLKWSGVRAPELPYVKNPSWGEPVVLFNGENLDGWHAMGKNQWIAESGILKSPKPGSNLVSNQEFMDFKLHIEFRYPKNGNSGVYLRGRYEVQVCDSKGKLPSNDQFGSIFGFLEPNEMVAKSHGEWQTYNITLIGRRVTIEANGSIIINNQRLPAITGGAINSNEAEPGPFMLQGDHDPIEYRNIIVTPMITRM
jgi:hypothetical protein